MFALVKGRVYVRKGYLMEQEACEWCVNVSKGTWICQREGRGVGAAEDSVAPSHPARPSRYISESAAVKLEWASFNVRVVSVKS